jgi:hypothetical protein
MPALRFAIWLRKGTIANVLSICSILMAILMTIVFFTSCETSNPKTTADQSSVIREGQSDHEIHGEVGAGYGHSF